MHPKFILKNHTSSHSFQTRLGSRVLTGSSRSILFFNQNDVILVKKQKTKVNGLQPDFWPGFVESAGSHQIFSSLFFFNPTRFQPRVARRVGPRFQNYGSSIQCIFFVFLRFSICQRRNWFWKMNSMVLFLFLIIS